MRMYDKYKDTGIIWIGAIPIHWNLRLLSQVSYEYFVSNKKIHHQNLLSLSYGKVIRKDINKTEGLLPASFDTYQVVREGNIILRLTDLQNDQKSLRVGLVKEEGIITSAYICLGVLKNSISPAYLYNVLHSYDVRKLFYSMGGGLRQGLNWQGLKKINIPLPPFAEQEKIVNYLNNKISKIDAFLLAKEEQIRLLQELKESEIANVITRGLNHNVKMKDSRIPWLKTIPEHWDEERAKYLFNRESRSVSETDDIITCFRDGQVTLRKNRRTTGFTESFKECGYQGIRKGDLVIHQMDAFAGAVGISDSDGKGTPVYIVCTPKRSDVYNPYFAMVIRAMGLNGYIQSLYRGIRERSSDFKFDVFRLQYLPLPPIEEQKAIVTLIQERSNKVISLINELQAEIEYLKEYKQSLVADCVTGQINVQ